MRPIFRMPSVVLTGGRARRVPAKRRRRVGVKIPRLPKSRRTRPVVAIKSPGTATASERAALQNLAQRLQRGNFTHWRSANTNSSPATNTAAQSAATSGQPTTAIDLITGTTASATPISGTGRRRRRTAYRKRRGLKGGFFPALIPLIAAAIGAIPGIAGTAVGIASLKEQQRQFNEQQKQFNRMYGNK